MFIHCWKGEGSSISTELSISTAPLHLFSEDSTDQVFEQSLRCHLQIATMSSHSYHYQSVQLFMPTVNLQSGLHHRRIVLLRPIGIPEPPFIREIILIKAMYQKLLRRFRIIYLNACVIFREESQQSVHSVENLSALFACEVSTGEYSP